MSETGKRAYTASGKNAEYLAKALDRIDVPYTRGDGSVSLSLSDEEIIEAEKMIRCEKAMEKLDYRFAVVSFKTSIDYPKLDKILKSVGVKAFFILDEDVEEDELSEDYETKDPFSKSRIPKKIS